MKGVTTVLIVERNFLDNTTKRTLPYGRRPQPGFSAYGDPVKQPYLRWGTLSSVWGPIGMECLVSFMVGTAYLDQRLYDPPQCPIASQDLNSARVAENCISSSLQPRCDGRAISVSLISKC